MNAATASQQYTAENIQILEGLEAVRKRPGMYIGDTASRGLHHLVYEIVDNSLDEALAGICDQVEVTIHPDDSVSVEDNGRGIPVDQHPTSGKSAAEVVLTVLHAGGKFDNKTYQVSGGLHGVGLSVVNALSEWLELTIWKNGQEWKQSYRRGIPSGPLTPGEDTTRRGTKIHFLPDSLIFPEISFSWDILASRLRELAFLTPGISIVLRDQRQEKETKFAYEGGIQSFVEHLNRGKETLFAPPLSISGEKEGVFVDVAIQYNDSYMERIFPFANLIHTIEGGTHVSGFRTALTRGVNEMARREKLLKEKEANLTGEDLKEGLTAVISVKLPEPQFEGQTKTKLGNGEIKGIVDSMVYDSLLNLLEDRPEALKPIVNNALKARQAREAAKKARELVRRKSALSGFDLPGKLADCSSKDPQTSEIYIVEGNSAGGSAKQGRDRSFQAILPLRGKILNVEKARLDRALSNNEIRTIIQALGCGVGDEFDISRLRYHRTIIMTDADVDGAHIRTLLLTLFFRFMPQIIEQGHLYVAQPPLYRIQAGKAINYCYAEKQLREIITALEGKKYVLQRYKGLGEMNPEQLWETTMDPAGRVLKRVEIDDAVAADEAFSILMGDKVEPRRDFIEKHAREVRNLDVQSGFTNNVSRAVSRSLRLCVPSAPKVLEPLQDIVTVQNKNSNGKGKTPTSGDRTEGFCLFTLEPSRGCPLQGLFPRLDKVCKVCFTFRGFFLFLPEKAKYVFPTFSLFRLGRIFFSRHIPGSKEAGMYVLHRTRIRHLRMQRSYTQRELAERTGITQEYLSAIERGSRVPSLEIFLLLTEALDIPPSVLLCKKRSP